MIKCKYENGDEVGLRHVVTGVLIVRDDKILLEKRGTFNGKPLAESGKWAIIGGYLDRDENLEKGIRREIREETGWEVGGLTLLHINDAPDRRNDEDRQNVAIIYFASPIKQEAVTSEEVAGLEWFDLESLPPEEEFAFDHYAELSLYKKYLREKFPLPVVG
jgi:ADP-ribose pyrophosphatase YjhB (NUDIX family)